MDFRSASWTYFLKPKGNFDVEKIEGTGHNILYHKLTVGPDSYAYCKRERYVFKMTDCFAEFVSWTGLFILVRISMKIIDVVIYYWKVWDKVIRFRRN